MSGLVLADAASEVFSDHTVLSGIIGIIVTAGLTAIGWTVTSALSRITNQLDTIESRVRHTDERITRLDTLHPEGTVVGHLAARR
jgi:Flp pilus assembly pilin Flp